MSRGVNDVDAMFVELVVHTTPEAGSGRRGDGDSTFLFLFHPVHGGRAIMDFPYLVGESGVIQDTLGRRRLTGIDVRHDTDITVTLNWGFTGHGLNSCTFVTSGLNRLPAIVGERFVGLGHTMRVFPLLYCRAAIVSRFHELISKPLPH